MDLDLVKRLNHIENKFKMDLDLVKRLNQIENGLEFG
jgi:hypothetical protein